MQMHATREDPPFCTTRDDASQLTKIKQVWCQDLCWKLYLLWVIMLQLVNKEGKVLWTTKRMDLIHTHLQPPAGFKGCQCTVLYFPRRRGMPFWIVCWLIYNARWPLYGSFRWAKQHITAYLQTTHSPGRTCGTEALCSRRLCLLCVWPTVDGIAHSDFPAGDRAVYYWDSSARYNVCKKSFLETAMSSESMGRATQGLMLQKFACYFILVIEAEGAWLFASGGKVSWKSVT